MNNYSRFIHSVLYSLGLMLAVTTLFIFWGSTIGNLGFIRVEEWYGIFSVIFLYLALLPGALYPVFPNFPGSAEFRAGRAALGVLAFFFGLLHSAISFFFLLQGFRGLLFLSGAYILLLSFGFAALLILTILAATSLQFFAAMVGNRWKLIHRFVYLAGMLIIVHVFLLGSHFVNLSQLAAQVLFYALLFLFLLQSVRFQNYIQLRFPRYAAVAGVLITCLFFAVIIWFYVTSGHGHAHHFH